MQLIYNNNVRQNWVHLTPTKENCEENALDCVIDINICGSNNTKSWSQSLKGQFREA